MKRRSIRCPLPSPLPLPLQTQSYVGDIDGKYEGNTCNCALFVLGYVTPHVA